MDNVVLLQKAYESAKNAYAPYSHYYVGAALLTEDNELYTGCNIENASFSATNCAERTAFFNAINDGKRSFKKIAIVALNDEVVDYFVTPCGVCLQVMSEFCNKDFVVVIPSSETEFKEFTLSQLLPNAFGIDNLKQR